MSSELIYARKYRHITPLEKPDLGELDPNHEQDYTMPTFDEMYEKIIANTVHVLIPTRVKKKRRVYQCCH